MVTYKILLDTRRAKSDGTFPLQIRITHNRKSNTINSGIFLQSESWDEQQNKVANRHPNAQLINKKLTEFYLRIQKAVLELEDKGNYDFNELKDKLKEGSFKKDTQGYKFFRDFADKLISDMLAINKAGNAIVYKTATNKILSYANNNKLCFKDINYTFLEGFKRQLIEDGIKANSISNYFRTVRAIYNKAVKSKIIDKQYYPFLDVTIKTERTAKRAISTIDLLKIANAKLEPNSQEWHARNYFLISFTLIGTSFTDLAYLKKLNIRKGRLIYIRRKTNRKLDIRLHPYTLHLLSFYIKNDNTYLLPILPTNITEDSLKAKALISQWIKTTNKYLKRIADNFKLEDEVTTYVARHTWATSAKRLGFSIDLIAESLGHEYGNKITNIYLDSFDQSVIDEVNKKVVALIE